MGFANGRKVTLEQPCKLEGCNSAKEVSLFFDNLEIYTGFFVENDDDGDILLKKSGSCICLPYNRLIGWYYE